MFEELLINLLIVYPIIHCSQVFYLSIRLVSKVKRIPWLFQIGLRYFFDRFDRIRTNFWRKWRCFSSLGYRWKWLDWCFRIVLWPHSVLWCKVWWENSMFFIAHLVLFDLFDFNELNSLSLIDLEFMFISCCNATYKIFGSNSEVVEEEISTFLGNFYTEDSRINISQLLKLQFSH